MKRTATSSPNAATSAQNAAELARITIAPNKPSIATPDPFDLSKAILASNTTPMRTLVLPQSTRPPIPIEQCSKGQMNQS